MIINAYTLHDVSLILQLDLHKALSTNSLLAEDYRQQQMKFIQAKTLALRVIERKLEMEASLRDHKQVCIYTSTAIQLCDVYTNTSPCSQAS